MESTIYQLASAVGVAALAAAVLQETSRKELLAVAGFAAALSLYRTLFGIKSVETKPAPRAPPPDTNEGTSAPPAEVVTELLKSAEPEPAKDDVSAMHEDLADTPEESSVVDQGEQQDAKCVVAFDFDKCLMEKHWWGTYKNGPIENIHPGPSDFAHKDIASLFNRVLAEDGVRLAVASFGRKDVIRKAIVSVLGERADEVFITTPGDFAGYKDGWSMGPNFKNLELENISSFFGKLPYERIIFFDDDKNNIREAKVIGVKAHVTAPFTADHENLVFEHIRAFATSDGQSQDHTEDGAQGAQ